MLLRENSCQFQGKFWKYHKLFCHCNPASPFKQVYESLVPLSLATQNLCHTGLLPARSSLQSLTSLDLRSPTVPQGSLQSLTSLDLCSPFSDVCIAPNPPNAPKQKLRHAPNAHPLTSRGTSPFWVLYCCTGSRASSHCIQHPLRALISSRKEVYNIDAHACKEYCNEAIVRSWFKDADRNGSGSSDLT